MKKIKSLFMILVFIGISSHSILVRAAVNDFCVQDQARVLSQTVKEEISNWNEQLEKTEEKPQVVVMTLPDLKGETIEEVALKQFEALKIGNKGYDNGVLILLALEERQIRIEVGYGLEGALTDSLTGRILDANLDYLKNGDYSQGLYEVFKQVLSQIAKEYGYDLEGLPKAVSTKTISLETIFTLMIIVISLLASILKSGGGSSGGHYYRPSSSFKSSSHSSSSFGGGGSSGGGGASRGF